MCPLAASPHPAARGDKLSLGCHIVEPVLNAGCRLVMGACQPTVNHLAAKTLLVNNWTDLSGTTLPGIASFYRPQSLLRCYGQCFTSIHE